MARRWTPIKWARLLARVRAAGPWIAIVVGGMLLGAAAVAYWPRDPEPVVVHLSREVGVHLPPWGYDTDLFRFGPVAEPLCPRARGTPLESARPERALATACEVEEAPGLGAGAVVRVKLRPNLSRGRSRAPVGADAVRTALVDGWRRRAERNSKQAPSPEPKVGTEPGALLFYERDMETAHRRRHDLEQERVAWPGKSCDGIECLEGTGAYFARLVSRPTFGPVWELVPLEPNRAPVWFVTEPEDPLDAPELSGVHLAVALPNGSQKKVAQDEFKVSPRWADQLLVAAYNPARSSLWELPRRLAVMAQLRVLSQDPTFLRSIGGTFPPVDLLPRQFAPLRTPKSVALPIGGTLSLRALTNDRWSKLLGTAVPSSALTLDAHKPADESARRESGEYEVSLLALIGARYEQDAPAAFLCDQLETWFSPDHEVRRAFCDLMRHELSGTPAARPPSGALEAALDRLDAWVVPLAQIPIYDVHVRELIGYDTTLGIMDLERLRVAGEASVWPIWALVFGVGFIALGIGWIARRLLRQRGLRASVDALHHDLSAPLIGMRQAARRLVRAAPELRALEAELNEFLNVVDGLRLDPGDPVIGWDRRGTSLLWRDVVGPALSRFQEQLALRGDVGPRLELEARAPEPDPRVALSDIDGRRVLQNLLANALKYRRESEPSLKLRVLVVVGPQRITLSVSSWTDPIPLGVDTDELTTWGYRAPGAEASTHPGRGAGLAIVRRICEERGGSFRLTQRADPVTFEVRLVAAPDERSST